MVSEPAPPVIESAPPAPMITSLPVEPFRESAPEPPVTVSLPAALLTCWGAMRPVKSNTSLPAVPGAYPAVWVVMVTVTVPLTGVGTCPSVTA